ncbi:MAG: hypothetical protein CTY31_05070 [Hyphomicrobium sp.]|nr:MAG: hypothetical protein CTY39_03390 [Hyphomicrobium sp.]PPD00490.1 MAG: hypothetical protein CTY31_05070 [Hyphomicrobium sp.]
MAFLSANFLWHYKQEHTRQRQDASGNQSEQVNEQRQATCIDVAKKHSFPCLTYGPSAEPSEQYTAYDLKAQQEMAEWALAMVLISVVGVIVTLAATAYVALTLDATREMNRITSEAFAFERRAWMRAGKEFFMGEVEIKGDTIRITAHPVFTNIGQTPARAVVIESEIFAISDRYSVGARIDRKFLIKSRKMTPWQKGDIVFQNDIAPTPPFASCRLHSAPGPNAEDFPTTFSVKYICRYLDGTSEEPRVTSYCYVLKSDTYLFYDRPLFERQSFIVKEVSEMPNTREVS